MNGPGKLTRVLGISRALHYGADLTVGPLRILEAAQPAAFEIESTPRIGIRQCAEWPLRFFVKGNSSVSRPALAAGRDF
jgi:DNA-3-methyladenine glycosylase